MVTRVKDRGLNEDMVLLTTKALRNRGKNEVQYPAVNSKQSHARRVKLTWLCDVCVVCLFEWKNGVCGSWSVIGKSGSNDYTS